MNHRTLIVLVLTLLFLSSIFTRLVVYAGDNGPITIDYVLSKCKAEYPEKLCLDHKSQFKKCFTPIFSGECIRAVYRVIEQKKRVYLLRQECRRQGYSEDECRIVDGIIRNGKAILTYPPPREGKHTQSEENPDKTVNDALTLPPASLADVYADAYDLYRAGERAAYGGSGAGGSGSSGAYESYRAGEREAYGGVGGGGSVGSSSSGAYESYRAGERAAYGGVDASPDDAAPPGAHSSLGACEGLNEEDAAACIEEYKQSLGLIDTLTDAFCSCRADASCTGWMDVLCQGETMRTVDMVIRHPIAFLACRALLEAPSLTDEALASGSEIGIPQVYVALYDLGEQEGVHDYYLRVYASNLKFPDRESYRIILKTAAGDQLTPASVQPDGHFPYAARFQTLKTVTEACLSFPDGPPEGVPDEVCSPAQSLP